MCQTNEPPDGEVEMRCWWSVPLHFVSRPRRCGDVLQLHTKKNVIIMKNNMHIEVISTHTPLHFLKRKILYKYACILTLIL